MTTNIAESMVRILAFPFKAFSWAGKLIDFVKSAVRVSPGAIAAYIVDFSVTTLAVYATIQTKLHASTIMLNRLYYAPEMAIYLAHQSQWHEKEPFVEASRRLFYPLCHFFATTDLNAQKMTSFDDTEDSDIKKIFRKQTENCLTIIAAYEDVELNSVSTRFESLLNEGKIDKETYDAYFEKKSISKKKIVDIITEVHKFYPDFYRILWVSGLKSVYTIDSLPTGFYGFKNLLIYGEGFEENDNYYSYLSTSIGKQGEEENVLQFEWTIEKLAYRAKDLKIEAGRGTKDDPLNLTEAYSIFWRHHSKKQKEFSEEALKLLKKDKKSWLGHVWNGFVAAKENLQWVFYRLFSDPYKLTFRYEVEQNLKSIPVN